MTERLENVLVSLIQALEQTDIPYTLVGGMAVLAWGDPRTTRDIDVIADLDRADLKTLEETLEPRGFSFDMTGAETALQQESHFTIFHEDSFYHVDLLPANDPSHAWTLEARERVELEGQPCWIASAEDTIANKLVYGSEQDIQDAAGILARRHPDIDHSRLESLCTDLGVEAELESLKRRVSEGKE